MKNKNRINIFSLLLMGLMLIFINSCKKDDDKSPIATVPVLTTSVTIDVEVTTATCGGNITNDGGAYIIARGVCWSTSSTPTIADNKTTNGNGAGSYKSTIKGLAENSTYYVRAYATNISGTGYGSAISFKTFKSNTDYDGNVYHTVAIGTQVWMVENLKTTRYRNGDLIGTTIPANKDIQNEVNPKYQWAYDGNESNVAVYGRLYTWHAINDSRNIAPAGWHVATDAEWTTLENYLKANGYSCDGTTGNYISKALAATSNWALSTNEGAVGNTDYDSYRNKSGFTALPAGYRYDDGTFGGISEYCYFWNSTEDDLTYAWIRYFHYQNSYELAYGSSKDNGFSVRCVKD